MPTQTATPPAFAAWQEACERAVQWCAERQNADGSIDLPRPCLDGHYKFPAAFTIMGRYVEAGKLLDWIEREALTESGDIRFCDPKFIFGWFQNQHIYTNTWILIAAQRAGFFRLAQRAMGYVERYQNPKTGAFRSGPIETDKTGRCDTTVTSQGGIAALYTGRLDVAQRAGDALCQWLDLHPKDADRFYLKCRAIDLRGVAPRLWE